LIYEIDTCELTEVSGVENDRVFLFSTHIKSSKKEETCFLGNCEDAKDT